MRQKRAKTYKRVMALYVQTFGFRHPFQILVSHDVLLESSKSNMDIVKVLGDVVQGECKPMITQCCMEALYALGKDHQQITNLAKTFERRRCNHRTAIEGNECLKDVIGQTNKHRYVLASQSQALRTSLEIVSGLPIIHFNRTGVLVLSPPSTATIREKNKGEEARRLEGLKEMEGVVDGGNVVGANQAVSQPVIGRKKVKGVNPLSMKKKKKDKQQQQRQQPENQNKKNEGVDVGKKRRREDDEGLEDVEVEEKEKEQVVQVETDTSGKKKRRKRKKKSAVADAIAELNAMNDSGSEGE
ncbi:U3 small nucleolar RNA-associated protein 23 [Kwoniella mangroviensis CBS 10435]|uniref:U three protein 23 n=1 Tax=Kwoniella mangroviensis CBS 10435 TaxID=1331196 RepID=A0A1B9IL20_9TREE|nr:U3 small nucleolar RNA-associated protein 23 [Kwoniella mangroviensis CBS 10435]